MSSNLGKNQKVNRKSFQLNLLLAIKENDAQFDSFGGEVASYGSRHARAMRVRYLLFAVVHTAYQKGFTFHLNEIISQFYSHCNST